LGGSGTIQAMPAPPFNVLFVCVGNVCRSPLAQSVLRLRLQEQLGDLSGRVEVTSAGVRAMVGRPMERVAAAELARLGGSASDFTARQLTEPVAARADLILTATKELRSRVLEEAPGALRRTFTITEFAALVRGEDAESPVSLVRKAAQRRSSAQVQEYDVPDPIGRSEEVHREAADLVDASVTPIAEALAAAVRAGAVSGPPSPGPS
jgi:protein-tyrosine phosphatase